MHGILAGQLVDISFSFGALSDIYCTIFVGMSSRFIPTHLFASALSVPWVQSSCGHFSRPQAMQFLRPSKNQPAWHPSRKMSSSMPPLSGQRHAIGGCGHANGGLNRSMGRRGPRALSEKGRRSTLPPKVTLGAKPWNMSLSRNQNKTVSWNPPDTHRDGKTGAKEMTHGAGQKQPPRAPICLPCGDLDEGSVFETTAAHMARHASNPAGRSPGRPGRLIHQAGKPRAGRMMAPPLCSRCVFCLSRAEILKVANIPGQRGATWVEERPQYMGGKWGIGCRICAWYLARGGGESLEPPPKGASSKEKKAQAQKPRKAPPKQKWQQKGPLCRFYRRNLLTQPTKKRQWQNEKS
jgi:hypothetical protein